MNREDLIKKIDDKIAQLEKEENPNELLKKALLKKNIIEKNKIISKEQFEKLFELLKNRSEERRVGKECM